MINEADGSGYALLAGLGLVSMFFLSVDREDDIPYSSIKVKPETTEVQSQWYPEQKLFRKATAYRPLDIDGDGTFDVILKRRPDLTAVAFVSDTKPYSLEQVTDTYNSGKQYPGKIVHITSTITTSVDALTEKLAEIASYRR